MTFEGLRVLSLESRRAREMEALIPRYGGAAFVAPSVREKPVEESPEILAWADRLMAGAFDMVVLTTGTGLAYLRDALAPRYSPDRLAEALRLTALVARGPKPVAVLHEMGLKAQVVVPEPNTWREMVPLIAARPERRVTILEYGKPNRELELALIQRGASVDTLAVYRWDLPSDVAPLREAVRRIASLDAEVVIFTTSVQLTHLLRVAAEMGLEREVRTSLAEGLVVASVGPVMNQALAAEGLSPDIVPAHPKMGPLVRASAEQARAALARKRGALVAG